MSCNGLNARIDIVVSQETDILIYECADCGEQWCSQAQSVFDIPAIDMDNFSDSGSLICPFCESHNVYVIGEIIDDVPTFYDL